MPPTPTPNLRSDVTIVDLPLTPSAPPVPPMRGRFAWLADKLADQPTWVQVAVAIVVMLIGAMGDRTCTRRDPAPQPVAPPQVQPAPVVVPVIVKPEPPPAPAGWAQVVNTAAAERQRFVGEHFRRMTSRQLQRDGFALVGGDKTPLSAEAADKLVAKLSDPIVYDSASSVGAFDQFGEAGGLLGFIKRIAQWVRDHPEQVQAILKILLAILMAFGDPVATACDHQAGVPIYVPAVSPNDVVMSWT